MTDMSERATHQSGGRLLSPGWSCLIAASMATLTGVVGANLEATPLANDKAEQLFAHQLWPALVSSCLPCHGDQPEKLKGGLDLRSLESALRGGNTGTALVPGDAPSSPMIEAIEWENEDFQMPPKESERLTPKRVNQFRQWIDAGAPWPSAERMATLVQTTENQWQHPEGIPMVTSGGLKPEWTHRPYQPADLWSYQPLDKPQPSVSGRHPIDAFIEAKLESRGIEPAPPADRSTLIRRATYDLLGLPPTPNEVKEFLDDPGSDAEAFARAVDRLLASPHYGEQWARHWLDVVRYADTSGFANDFDRGNAWRYRDYVVRAFNQDKPYGTFVREQIAGDEIDPHHPEHLIAVGFLRMGPWELTGMEVAAIARQRFLDDVVNAVGQTFLGHTLRCAKCHDHKFDPIPTRDYYRFYTIFNTTQLAERDASFLPHENTEGFEERAYLIDQRQVTQDQLKRLNEKSRQAIAAWFQERDLPYRTREAAQKAGAGPDDLPPRRYGFSVEDFGRERIGRKTLNRLTWKLERYEPIAFSVYSGPTPIRNAYTTPQRIPHSPQQNGELEKGHILTGGDVFSPAAEVHPEALSLVNHLNPALASIEFPRQAMGRRTALAEWIAHPQNPLTYRTIANRIWQWHFGQALAGNPNNLGATGKKPSHPALLDWLAAAFRDHGGSFKSMHRLIMNSDAYRRASRHPSPDQLRERDPQQQSYAVFLPRRLSSEELRDSMLRVSGELNLEIGGIPNRPEINLEVALQPRMVMGTFATAWQPNPLPRQRHRRSLYALKVRGLRDPFMEVFNQPDPDLSCEGRDASNVTPQVFSLFNSQIAYDRAVAFANRIASRWPGRNQQIAGAFDLAFTRQPSPAEFSFAKEHYHRMLQRHQQSEIPKPIYPASVVREAVEENTGETFQFTERLGVFEDFVADKKLADLTPEGRALAELCLVLFNSNEFAYVY